MEKLTKLFLILCALTTTLVVSCSDNKEENLPTFKVAFETNGGSEVTTQDVEAGSKVSQPSKPTKEGAVFGGWYKDIELTTAWDFAKDVVVDKNITLYAKWTSQYWVAFDAKGGTPTPDTLWMEADSKITKPTTEPSLTNGTFLGWFSDDAYKNEWDFEENIVTENITLRAKWSMEIVVTFNAMGGEPTPVQQELEEGEKIVEPTEPTKDGHRFIGWYMAETSGAEWNFNTGVSASLTLYAYWEETVTYTVTFETNGGSEVEAQEVAGHDVATKPETPTKSGFAFVAWHTEEALTEVYDFTTPVEAAFTLYAEWVSNTKKFTVTFVQQNPISYEETETAVEYNAGSKLNPPTTAVYDNYEFEGWKINKGGNLPIVDIWDMENDKVTEDVTLVTSYNRIAYVNFDANGGNPTPARQKVVSGSKVEKPTNVTNGSSKTLEGWYAQHEEPGTEQKWNFEEDILYSETAGQEFTFRAKWISSSTVTFKNGEDTHDTKTVLEGEPVLQPIPPTTPPAGTPAGAKFIGWSATTSVDDLWDFATTVESAMTLKAVWSTEAAATYSVNFYLDQENLGTPYQTISGIEHGGRIQEIVKDPTSKDSKFSYWYYIEDGREQQIYNGLSSLKITSDLNIYARWSPYFTVTFDTDGGSTAPVAQKLLEHQIATKPTPNPTKEEFLFEYWGMKYFIEDTLQIFEYTFNNGVSKDITLYAKWIPNDGSKVSIRYFDTSSSYEKPIKIQEVEKGTIVTPFEAPGKEGMLFVGWRGKYEHGEINDFTQPIVKDIDLYASYVEAGRAVEVSFESYSLSEDNYVPNTHYESQTVQTGGLVTEPTPTPGSYTHEFLGWYTQRKGGELWNFATDKVMNEYMILYIHWGKPSPDTRLYKHIKDIEGIYSYYNDGTYTDESWDAYTQAMNAERENIRNSTLTNQQVEAGITRLNTAVDNLVKKQFGATTKIKLGSGFSRDSDGNMILISKASSNSAPTRVSLASLSYKQMQNIGTENSFTVYTYDASDNETNTEAQAFADDAMGEWVYSIASSSSYIGRTHISIRVKESGSTGKLTIMADQATLEVPVKHYAYNQAKSYLLSEMRSLPAIEDITYEHSELVSNLGHLASNLSNINSSDSEVSAARKKLWEYEEAIPYKIHIERNGNTATMTYADDTYESQYIVNGEFPYGEYIDEWYYDIYNDRYEQHKTVLKSNGTFEEFIRESEDKNEETLWGQATDSRTLTVDKTEGNTSIVYVKYVNEDLPISRSGATASSKGKSSLMKMIEKQQAVRKSARK